MEETQFLFFRFLDGILPEAALVGPLCHLSAREGGRMKGKKP
jgi:hypothetical protein